MNSFWVDLKAYLGSVLPNQYHVPLLSVKIEAGQFYFVGHTYSFVVPTMNHNSVVHRELQILYCRFMFIAMFYVEKINNLERKLDEKTNEIKENLTETLNRKVIEIETSLNQISVDDDMLDNLRPALEQLTKTCLSSEPKCNVGDINCTEIDLLGRKANCIQCVDGALVPFTDYGTNDYCPHNVSSLLNITVDHNSFLNFTTINDTISVNISTERDFEVEDNTDCGCSWAFYSYTNFSNTPPTITPIINGMLFCDECDPKKWFCLKKNDKGVCGEPNATCQLPGNGTPKCSLNDYKEYKIAVEVTGTCNTPAKIECHLSWNLDSSSIVNNGKSVSFNVKWDESSKNRITIINCTFDKKEGNCKSVSDCNFEDTEYTYHYDFFKCNLDSEKKPVETDHDDKDNDNSKTKATPSTWLILIIVVLVIVFLLYVGYQNYQKVSFVYKCM